MRQVTLSDFVGDRIREAQRERANRFEFERRAYELSAPKRRGRLTAMLGVVAIAVIAMMIIDAGVIPIPWALIEAIPAIWSILEIWSILDLGAISLGLLALILLVMVTKEYTQAPRKTLGVVAIAVIALMIDLMIEPIWRVTWGIPWAWARALIQMMIEPILPIRDTVIPDMLGLLALILLAIVTRGIYSGSPKMSEPSDQEEIWRAGEIGEQQTADAFGRVLNDNWVLLKGYKNSKGEIDQIFVGPGGVTAVEIKNYNGVIHIDGDSWTRHRRYVSAGNVAETVVEPVQDAGGRAPSRQLNEPASQLQKFLSERSNVKRVNRAVILTHDNSQIGPIFNLTVDYVVTLNDIRRRDHHVFVFGDGRVSLDRESVDRISSLIRQDHDFHNKSDDK